MQRRVQHPAGRQLGDQHQFGGSTDPGTSSGTSGGSTPATQSASGPTRLVDEWAACERSHGDPGQADPTIDATGVIHITIPQQAQPTGDIHDLTGTCSEYLAAAQNELRAANPVAPPPDQSEYLKYVSCMRANGVPNYPYPTGDTTNFIGSGVDPDSPAVERVNQLCGKKIGAPAWWINGTDTPGSIEVHTAGTNPNPTAPACVFQKVNPCSGTVTVPPAAAGRAPAPGRVPMAEFSARQVVVIAAIAGALVGGLVGGGVAVAASGNSNSTTASSSGDSSQVATAPVVRTTLTNTVQVGGSIGYDGSYTVTALRGSGVYTWLPEPGQVIKQDQPVYSVSNEPVPLLYGSIPAYREFDAGMSDGADVGQLTRDLIALGYGAGLTQSDHYSSATAAAVERWQNALGLQATGEILLGEVVFEPGPIRVTSVTPSAGAPVGGGGGTVLTATSTTPIVIVDLDVSQEYLVKPGDAVSVVLPDGTSTVGGHIETVGTVATCPGGSGIGAGGGASGSAGQSPCESSGSGTSSAPTVTVTITLDSTPPGAALDQAPVNVNITSQTVDNVLAVPVNALLALQGGGYGVEVVTGKTSHLAGVTTGMYSDTLVQVSGSGITAGTVVEVPSS